jgi:hypothetical protein
VISPEGAASILGRYTDDAHKAAQFPLDCQSLATAQCIYAYQLQSLGVVDEVIWESASGETYQNFPLLKQRIQSFLSDSLDRLCSMSVDAIIEHRYKKFRALGTFDIMTADQRSAALEVAKANATKKKPPVRVDNTPSMLVKHLSEQIVTGPYSLYKKLAPPNVPLAAPAQPEVSTAPKEADWTNAKRVLDSQGPEALASWVRAQTKVLLTGDYMYIHTFIHTMYFTYKI